MNPPRVSVLVAFLNAERFLFEAVQSVFNQTYASWELLLVDDGSTDRSQWMAREWAAAYPDRVRYLDHPRHVNRGISASRNLGICNSQGEFIAVLDSDDVWFPAKLEQQVALMDAHPEAGLVCGASEYWYSWDEPVRRRGRDETFPLGVPQDQLIRPPEMLLSVYPLGGGNCPCPCTLLFRKTTLQSVAAFEEGFPNAYEDQACLAKIYLHSPVYVSHQCWDRYRQHADSCSGRLCGREYHRIRRHFLLWFRRYLRTTPPVAPEVKARLDEALEIYRWFYLKRLIRRLKRHAVNAGKKLPPNDRRVHTEVSEGLQPGTRPRSTAPAAAEVTNG
jgi:glycosyltransferase involved in cell wall biosynthesis